MSDPVRVAIVGMGGFAGFHRRALQSVVASGRAVHVSQVAPPPDHDPFADELVQLRQAGISVHDSLRQLLAADRDKIDLLCIPTGIPLHRSMVIAACEAGVDVLVEKPAAGSVQDVDAMIAARDRCKTHCTVGFQHVYQPEIQRLKASLVGGDLGQLQRIRGCGCWPRGNDYYDRNGWAGELAVGDTWVLDGPHNNALAHAVNLMAFLAGARLEISAEPQAVTAELYRVNAIQAADTVSLRAETAQGVDITFSVTHAADEESAPVFGLDTDQATIDLDFTGGYRVRWNDGREEVFEAGGEISERSVGGAVDWIAAGAPLEPGAMATTPHCSLEVARAQTLIACGTYESSAIRELPQDLRCEGPNGEIAIQGMTATVQRAFREGALFSEIDVAWAQSGERVSLDGYTYFPTFRPV
ncbi:MAG: Gfo/Idh/MocA family oxidoreductase [Gemmatimonadetes bacterium]|jgi:predicted dehydrogenase|nr:Gfo/Idh/MocA family oxidoreductase [Gemmatimonadota bacterium]MBT6144485.1 Gfo/Idh/MocA family oxidoreductase [Gemmatimonadota bacterium]MBT7862030.1 Gfo/Idh/MocA family oxidoreductase [Gemmatimonadota bacterium]